MNSTATVTRNTAQIQRLPTAMVARSPVVPNALRHALLDGFVPEERTDRKKAQTIEMAEATEGIKELVRLWKLDADSIEVDQAGTTRTIIWNHFLESSKKITFTASDIEAFSIMLEGLYANYPMKYSDLSKKEIGDFLTCAISVCKDMDIIIHTSQLSFQLNGLINYAGKNITVKGNLGRDTGKCMQSGTITVEGDVDSLVGSSMEGGKIIVKGNAGILAGANMSNGIIEIHGNCGPISGFGMTGGKIILQKDSVRPGDNMGGGEIVIYGKIKEDIGNGMKGGVIRVYGETPDIDIKYLRGGSIYVQDNLVIKNGKPVTRFDTFIANITQKMLRMVEW